VKYPAKYIFILLLTLNSSAIAADKSKIETFPQGQDRGGSPVENLKGTVKGAPLNVNSDKLLPFYSIFKTKGKTKFTCEASVDMDINVQSKNVGKAVKFIFECKDDANSCTVLADFKELDPKTMRLAKGFKKTLEMSINAGVDMYTSVNRVTHFEKATKTKDGWEIDYSAKVGKLVVNSQMTEMLSVKEGWTTKLSIIDGYLFVTNLKDIRDSAVLDVSTKYAKNGDTYFPSRIKSQATLDKNHLDYDIIIEKCKAE
jgi:hypothetical protein